MGVTFECWTQSRGIAKHLAMAGLLWLLIPPEATSWSARAQVPDVGPGRCVGNCNTPGPSTPPVVTGTPPPVQLPAGPTPAEVEAKREAAVFHYNDLAIAAAERGDWKTAVSNFEAALQYDPHNPVLQENLKKAKQRLALAQSRQASAPPGNQSPGAWPHAPKPVPEPAARQIFAVPDEARKAAAAQLRAEIKTIQDQLRKLQKYAADNSQNLDEMGAIVEKSKKDMSSQLISLTLDAVLGVAGKAVEDSLKVIGTDIAAAKSALKIETDSVRKTELASKLKSLLADEDKLNQAKYKIVVRGDHIKRIKDRVETLSDEDYTEGEKLVALAAKEVKELMSSETMKKLLAGGKELSPQIARTAPYLRSADAIGSVVGDLYLYYKNMDTILQGTANADAMRQQINRLSARMEKTVEKLKQVEGQT